MKRSEQVLWLIKKGRVFELSPADFAGRSMTKEEFIAILNYFGVFWQYQGKPRADAPHAFLKSEKHSNGFIVCDDVLQYPAMCTLFACEIVKVLEEMGVAEKVDVVVSSAYSAISLGWEVARILSQEYNLAVEYRRVEKDEKGNPTKIRTPIDPEKTVLVINELMTTGGGSTWETKKAVQECNGSNPAPKIIDPAFVLVHRSQDWKLADGSDVRAIFHFNIENFPDKEHCPYCKAGSEAIKPKIGNNWACLHGA